MLCSPSGSLLEVSKPSDVLSCVPYVMSHENAPNITLSSSNIRPPHTTNNNMSVFPLVSPIPAIAITYRTVLVGSCVSTYKPISY